MKEVTFISHAGDKSARFFLEFPVWAAGEMRRLEDEAAARLDAHFPGCFKIADPKPAKAPADAPAKD